MVLPSRFSEAWSVGTLGAMLSSVVVLFNASDFALTNWSELCRDGL